MLDDFICNFQSDEFIPNEFDNIFDIIEDEDCWYYTLDDNFAWFSDDEDYSE